MVLLSLNQKLPTFARLTRETKGTPVRRVIAEFSHVVRKPWAQVVLLTVFMEGAFLFGSFAFIASHLHRVHGLSLSFAGSLVMLFGFGGLLFATASSVLVKKLGEKGLAFWGGIFIAASLLIIGLSPFWWSAVPACFIAGLGFYMLHNTLQINATQMAPERRGASVAAFASCFYLGQSAGVSAAGILVERVGTAAVISVGAVGVLLLALNFGHLRLKLQLSSAGNP
jgi:predicted MFS family arabinose efflux permease